MKRCNDCEAIGMLVRLGLSQEYIEHLIQATLMQIVHGHQASGAPISGPMRLFERLLLGILPVRRALVMKWVWETYKVQVDWQGPCEPHPVSFTGRK